MYQFSYDTPYSLIKSFCKNGPSGANHLDDLLFLFKMRILDNTKLGHLKKGTNDYRMMEKMIEMWTNFAKYGRPTIERSQLTPVHWKLLTDGTLLRYLDIDQDITMKLTINLDQKLLSAKDIKKN